MRTYTKSKDVARWWFPFFFFFNFHPENCGRFETFDEHVFQMGGEKPPTRLANLMFLDLVPWEELRGCPFTLEVRPPTVYQTIGVVEPWHV